LAAHIAQNGVERAVRERLAGDEADVIDGEHDQAHADHEPNAAAWETQRDRRADQDEHDTRGRQRELLLNLDAYRFIDVRFSSIGRAMLDRRRRVERRRGRRRSRDVQGDPDGGLGTDRGGTDRGDGVYHGHRTFRRVSRLRRRTMQGDTGAGRRAHHDAASACVGVAGGGVGAGCCDAWAGCFRLALLRLAPRAPPLARADFTDGGALTFETSQQRAVDAANRLGGAA
jgi:hypothetical protein